MKATFFFVFASVLTLGYSAQAATELSISELDCKGANGLVVQLKKAGPSAVVKTIWGFATMDYLASIVRTAAAPELTFETAGTRYVMPVQLKTASKEKQVVSGVLWKSSSIGGSPRPSTALRCDIRLQ